MPRIVLTSVQSANQQIMIFSHRPPYKQTPRVDTGPTRAGRSCVRLVVRSDSTTRDKGSVSGARTLRAGLTLTELLAVLLLDTNHLKISSLSLPLPLYLYKKIHINVYTYRVKG